MKIRTAVLPVAGLGTRFMPITKSIPKEILPIVDTPLIQYVVEEAWSAGIEQVVLVSSRGKEVLENHFDSHPELETALSTKNKTDLLNTLKSLTTPDNKTIAVVRQSEPLGLGHAVLCARELVGNEPFAVLLPDDLVWTGKDGPSALKQMVTKFQEVSSSLVAVMEVEKSETDKYGIIDPLAEYGADDNMIATKGLIEKPHPDHAPSNLAIIGRYILTPEIFDLLASGTRGAGGEIQLTDAICALLDQQSVYGYRFAGVRYDCGDKTGYQMANLALSLHRPKMRKRLIPFLQDQLAQWGVD